MKETILITGASSGIGFEMAQLLAPNYHLILVARNEQKLEKAAAFIRAIYPNSKIQTYVCDLAVRADIENLYDSLKEQRISVDMLVNNAGMGVYGNFSETSLESEWQMIQVNVSGLYLLTKLFARDMAIRKKGKILNIASLLAFLPFPYFSVYSATKTFVLAFSETLAAELAKDNVTVTTLCPGPVDTAFQTSEMLGTNAYKTNKPVSAEIVAKQAVDLLLNGTGKKIPGFQNWFISNLPRITPDFLMMKIKKHLASPN